MQLSTRINEPSISTATFKDFKGVDFYNTKLNIAYNRASSMSNLIHKNGVNQKRNGYSQYNYFSNKQINGVWEYTDSYGKTHTIVHAGNKFYKTKLTENLFYNLYYTSEITTTNKYYPSWTTLNDRNTLITSSIVDDTSYGIIRGDRLYIFCGTYLVYSVWNCEKVDNLPTFDNTNEKIYFNKSDSKFYKAGNDAYEEVIDPYELRLVEDDEYTYIPSTTVTINVDSAETNARTIKDDVNLLSRRRRNKLIGEPSDTTVTTFVYTLDGTPDTNYPIEVKANGEILSNTYYSISGNKITFTVNQVPTIEGDNNIEVVFVPTNYVSKADRINKCKFGIFFGYNELQQLFVSGNDTYPNMDFRTDTPSIDDTILNTYEDLTYFGSLGYTNFGSTKQKVMGYSQVDDNTLAIHKEYSISEPCLYVRNASVGTAIDSAGNEIENWEDIRYQVLSSAIGEGSISMKANGNLAGDKLFVSKNGIYGLELSSNIKVNERYARTRSKLINNELITKDLSKAISIVYDGKYYLYVDKKVYIADSRFAEENSYEYYIWELNLVNESIYPLSVWFIKDNKLWFGTKDGKCCCFNTEYVDKNYYITNLGEITLSDTTEFTKSANVSLHNGDIVDINKQTGSTLFELLLDTTDIINITNNEIKVSDDVMNCYIQYNDNEKVFIDLITNASSLSVNTAYYIRDVDISNNTFKLHNGTSYMDLSNDSRFRICRFASLNSEVEMTGTNTFKLRNYQDLYNLETNETTKLYKRFVAYNGGSVLNLILIKHIFNNVKCSWYSVVTDLGNSGYLKTTKYITITPEAIENSDINVGILTKDTAKNIQANTYGVDVHDYGNQDYTQLSFDMSTFARAYSKKLKIRNFNFIQIYFESDTSKNCIMHSIDIAYTITKKYKGVR